MEVDEASEGLEEEITAASGRKEKTGGAETLLGIGEVLRPPQE